MSAIDEHRAYLLEIQAIGKDEEGREVLVGLTHDETEEYLRASGIHGATDRWLELDKRFNAARAQITSAENDSRFAGPNH